MIASRFTASQLKQFVLNLAFLLAMALLLLLTHAAGAEQQAAGDEDESFGGFAGDGRVEIDDMEVLEIAQHGESGWVVLGRRTEQLVVRRFTYDGALDSSFGNGGTTVFETNGNPCAFFGENAVEECGIAVQSNGGIIVAGATTVGGDKDFLIYRLHPGGDLDTSFGQNGSRVIDFDDGDDRAFAVAVQENDRIIVVGLATDPDPLATDDFEFATARLTADGDPDFSFSGDGLSTISFGGTVLAQLSHALAVAIQPDDGRIVVGGEADDTISIGASRDHDFGLLRYLTNGTPDDSFGGDGKVNSGFGGNDDYVTSLYIQPNGQIVAAGAKNEDEGFALARYNRNGVLDDSFNGSGKVTTPIGSKSKAVAVTGQPDDKLLALGISDGGTAIVRYNEDGSPDMSYSDDGIRILLANQGGRDLALQPDGKYLIASSGTLARYQTNLMLLDKAGVNTTGFGYGADRGYAVAPAPGGGYLVAAESASPLSSNGLDVVLVRYTASGQLDRSFGENGRAEYNAINDDSARAMVVQPDGKVLVAGFRHHTVNEDFALWRFNANGTVDSSFGSAGLARGFFGFGPDYGQDLVLQEDGKIVVAGFSEDSSGRYLTMIRFDAEGELDTTFAEEGKFIEAQGQAYFSLRALAELPDGDLLAVGGYAGDFWAYRFSADGVPDPSFGSNGYKRYVLSGNDEAHAIGVLDNGRIVIGGYSGGDLAMLVIRDDGEMWISACNFFGDSRVTIDMGGDEVAYDLAVQSDDKILLVGSKRSITNDPGPMYAARFHPANCPTKGFVLDPSFSPEGVPGAGGVSFIHGSRASDLLLHDDKIVIAGLTRNGVDADIALVRLLNNHTEPPLTPPTPTPTGIWLPLVLR